MGTVRSSQGGGRPSPATTRLDPASSTFRLPWSRATPCSRAAEPPPCCAAPATATAAGGGGDDFPLHGRFQIPAPEVQSYISTHGVTMAQFLTSLIQAASRMARPPVSGYHVGAAGLGASGSVYLGVNLEFPGAALNNSVHAEQFLLVNCLHGGEQQLQMLAVSAAPCGHCRQFYAELTRADDVAFYFGSEPQPRSLEDLLPSRFGPRDLSPDDPFPLVLEPRDNKLAYTPGSVEAIAARSQDAALQTAAAAALAEANKAYSPYTRCYSGASIITHGGEVYSGGSIESCAYNPSLSPLHTAYIDAVAGGMKGFGEIKEVVVAEIELAAVRHSANVQLLLNSVAPTATLTLLQLQLATPMTNPQSRGQ